MFLVGVAKGEVVDDEELLVEETVVAMVVDLPVDVDFCILAGVEVLILDVGVLYGDVIVGVIVLVETTADVMVLVVVLQVALILLAEQDAVPE